MCFPMAETPLVAIAPGISARKPARRSGKSLTWFPVYRTDVFQSVPIEDMIKRAQANLPNPMEWAVSLNHMPMKCGYSVTCPNNQNGVYAGDGVGGGSDSGGGGVPS